MKSQWRRFAPFGLYLAGLALVVAAALYLVQRAFTVPIQISLALVVVGLAAFAFLDPDSVRAFLTGRQARYGSNALILSVAFIGILVVVNFLGYENSKRWDLTEDQQYTLTKETVNTLKALPKTVEAVAFYTPQFPSQSAQDLLKEYQQESNGKFEYRFVDPVSDPVLANSYNVMRDGTIILVMGDRHQQVDTASENDITSGLVRLINPEQRKVYFLTGQGEFDPEGSGQTSYSSAKSLLESKNYTVDKLNLIANPQIPEDASLIIVAAPKKPLSQAEVDALSGYLEKGGALMVMEEPLPVTDFGDQADPLADYLAKTWGINLGKDMVVDLSSSQASVVAVGSQYNSHSITANIQGSVTLMPTARSVTLSDVQGSSQSTLVSTGTQAWAETDLKSLASQDAQVKPDQGSDLFGPVPLAAVAENFDNKARLVVFGDGDFISNQYFSAYANSDLFINAADWATSQENLINLTPKETTKRFLLPPQRLTMNLIQLGSVFLLPGLFLFAGVIVWANRRQRG